MAKQSSDEGRERLGSLIDGRTDDEIVAGIQRRGADTVLDQIFRGMVDVFMPAKAGDIDVVIGYEIRVAESTHRYKIQIAKGKCKMVKGSSEPARTVAVAAVPDFLRLITGKQNGVTAYMTGKLKLRGDILFFRTAAGWFRQR
jgi:hypothetical protein